MSYPIKPLSLQKAELEYEVLLRGGTTGSVQELRSQIVKLNIPSEDILESHLDPSIDLIAVKDSLQKSQTMITSLKYKFDKNMFLRTENLLHHIYHRNSRISNIGSELAAQHKANCNSFTTIYRELSALRPNYSTGSSSEPEPNVTNNPITCDRNLTSDLARLRFSGKSCVLSFIQKVDEFVEARNIPKDRLLKFGYEIFTDDALHWFRCIKERVNTWDDVVTLLKQDFRQKDYDYRLLAEIRSRAQGELENITVYLSIMHGMFSRLSKPLSEDDKLEIILHNIRPCYASTLAASSEIRDLNSLKTICCNYESIQSRLSLFREPPRVTSETLAPDFAYTKQQRFGNHFNNNNKNYNNRNETYTNYNTQNKQSNYSNKNYNNNKDFQQKVNPTNAVPIKPHSLNYVQTMHKYCPRCRSDSHSLKECRQPHYPICFKCGQKGIRYPDCTVCNPKINTKKN
ncbi:uncharacterized protein [Choristoneura fumiferana]|uniref:uncharacterized protein n=1 Tax=Choristoneura fumiferana TaxID=7141 RepID=UPI003D158106